MNKLKTYMFVFYILPICLSGCDVVVDSSCIYDWECEYGEICYNGHCVSYGSSGHLILECGCWYYTLGERRTNLNCISGYDITFSCNWWCPEGGLAWGRMCE